MMPKGVFTPEELELAAELGVSKRIIRMSQAPYIRPGTKNYDEDYADEVEDAIQYILTKIKEFKDGQAEEGHDGDTGD